MRTWLPTRARRASGYGAGGLDDTWVATNENAVASLNVIVASSAPVVAS